VTQFYSDCPTCRAPLTFAGIFQNLVEGVDERADAGPHDCCFTGHACCNLAMQSTFEAPLHAASIMSWRTHAKLATGPRCRNSNGCFDDLEAMLQTQKRQPSIHRTCPVSFVRVHSVTEATNGGFTRWAQLQAADCSSASCRGGTVQMLTFVQNEFHSRQ
jgi:hypothetical protein